MNKMLFFICVTLFSTLAIANKASDSDRGCCVWKTAESNKCTQTNLSYCRDKAKKASIDYKFLKKTNCKNVDFCPVKKPTKK